MIVACLVALLGLAPPSASVGAPAAEAPPATSPATPTSRPAATAEPLAAIKTGTLTLRAATASTVRVHDFDGHLVADITLTEGQVMPLKLPPGHYVVTDDRGGQASYDLAAASEVSYGTAEGPPTPSSLPPPVAPLSEDYDASDEPEPTCGGGPCRRWKQIAAPLMSAALPGSGQIVNGEPGKGLGMFLGALSLGTGALALHLTRDPVASTAPGLQSTTFGGEAVGAAGFGVLTGGLALLYAAQIMDAYATAVGIDRPRPYTGHRVAVQWTRMATVGLRAGDPARAFYADWNLSLLAQVRRRLSVGVSDLGLRYGIGRTSMQGGARLHYRFFDRDRLWLGAAAGAILQGTVGRLPQALGDPPAVRANAFAVIPYGQLDLRLFLLDRWSIDLTPRLSVPLGTRFYRGDLALPAHALTFELGTGVGVYF